MENLEFYFLISICVQMMHSLEEIFKGFHKNNFLFEMPFSTFLIFEICFIAFFWSVFWLDYFPLRDFLMQLFLLIMFANGIWHTVWARVVKKYVPGLVTAPLHILVFVCFYFS